MILISIRGPPDGLGLCKRFELALAVSEHATNHCFVILAEKRRAVPVPPFD